jgi:hypothetical protein
MKRGLQGKVQTIKTDIDTLDDGPQVCYEDGEDGWVVSRIIDVYMKPIWKLANGDRLTPDYFHRVVVVIDNKEIPLQEDQWEFALNHIGRFQIVSVNVEDNVASIPYLTDNYKELYTSALRKLDGMSDEELREFLGQPKGALLGRDNKALLEKINEEATNKEWLDRATRFVIEKNGRTETVIEMREQYEGPPKWVVKRDGYVMNKKGEFEYEPIPSSRTSKFINATRFKSYDEAYHTWLRQKSKQRA